MNRLICPFREEIRSEGTAEVATCGLVLRVIQSEDRSLAKVSKQVCQFCCASGVPNVHRFAKIAPSLIYKALHETAERSDTEEQLFKWCEDAIDSRRQTTIPRLNGCDVICVATNDSESTYQAIESVLNQQSSRFILHLIVGAELMDIFKSKFCDIECIRYHHRELLCPDNGFACDISDIGPVSANMRALQNLIPRLRMPYVAFQFTNTTSEPYRLRDATDCLEQQGAEIFAASMIVGDSVIDSKPPQTNLVANSLLTETTVFRRATLVDMGGIADLKNGEDSELYWRACNENRHIVINRQVAVKRIRGGESNAHSVNHSEYVFPSTAKRSLRDSAIGFGVNRQRCDVVLPFHGHLNYVEESMDALLGQQNVDPIIHLIDDASVDDTHSLFKKFADCEKVRLYRNQENLGQFLSVNNVFPYLETPFLAIQDADDISLPNRLYRAIHALTVSGADMFAASMELFGDQRRCIEIATETDSQSGEVRYLRSSSYPRLGRPGYFLENPSIVMRKSLFERLGGYADYGSTERNRTGIDTEFMIRAHLAGAHIAVSRDVLLKYRCHSQSATQCPETGWDSSARRLASKITDERTQQMQQSAFDPRILGSLGDHFELTVRVEN